MKRILTLLLLLSIIVSGILIVFSNDIKNKLTMSKPEALQTIQNDPIAYMVDDHQPYNFMYPFYNEMASFYINDTVALWNGEETLIIQIDQAQVEDISYIILDPLTEEEVIRESVSRENLIQLEKGVRIHIKPEGLINEKRYILNIEGKVQGQKVDFYQNLFLLKNNQTLVINTVVNLHSLMYEGETDYQQYLLGKGQGGFFYDANQDSSQEVLLWSTIKDFVKMNEPIPQILAYNTENGDFKVKLQFVIAIRKADGFEYWDFTEIYSGKLIKDEIQINSYKRTGNKKNLPYFNSDTLQWVIDEGYQREESSSILSENGDYLAFVYKNEVWLLNKKYNELTKVFGFDAIDSDYIIDESEQHKIKLLQLDDKGNMKYVVYGYMAAGDFAGYNGIMINEYNNKRVENESLLFVKLSKDYKALEYYIENASYYNTKDDVFYIAIQLALYRIDVGAGTIEPIKNLSDNMMFSEEGVLYYSNPHDKETINTQFYDLTAKKIDKDGKQVILENTYIKVLGTINEGLIIGAYQLQDTFEYLDGTIFYPYHSIYLVQRTGKLTKIIESNSYLSNIVINKEEGRIYATQYNLEQRGSKVNINKGSDQAIYQFEQEAKSEEKVIGNEIIDNLNNIYLSHSSISLREQSTPTASNIHKKYVLLDAQIEGERLIYEAYNQETLVGVSKELVEALRSNAKQLTHIYSLKGGQRKLQYNRSNQPQNILIDVPIMAQRPELIRGCESTALAMFLSYYTGQNIDKVEVADKLRRDTTPKTMVNGMISFGDMNKGFVGSMTDSLQPGLGAYVEPVYDVAQNYVEDVHNITGASFNQIMDFVGKGQPVWVITPINYNKVSEYVLQQWITPSGYMEVTYLEHAVVIVGYDDTYVYLNDPQQGRVIKQPRISFQVGWENQGSQALVVTP